ncbi:uncharacterized protein [Onthophagus taurus]|uniref:uncharacterized protein isoform X2 n=1 Tax=Onthophagus taurus TaxID=166361 RepID=UPI0039BDFE2E
MTTPLTTCFVPSCDNTKTNNPRLYFLSVPQNEERRKKWFDAVGLDRNPTTKSNLVCCEEHFDLENDSQNFGYFKHFKGTNLLLKRDVVPHKKLTKVVSQRTKKPMLEFVQCIQDEETSEVSSPTKSSDPITPSDELMRMESSMSSAEDQILFEEIEDSKDDITLTSPSISIPVEKKRKRVYTSNTEKDIDSTRTSLCNISHEDVFDHFGKLIASQLRGIRMGDALQLQSDISAMVNQRLMSIYNRDKSMAALEQPSQSTVLSPIYNDPEEIDTKPIIYTDS